VLAGERGNAFARDETESGTVATGVWANCDAVDVVRRELPFFCACSALRELFFKLNTPLLNPMLKSK
jgi:hypothetical protein